MAYIVNTNIDVLEFRNMNGVLLCVGSDNNYNIPYLNDSHILSGFRVLRASFMIRLIAPFSYVCVKFHEAFYAHQKLFV